MLATAWPEFRIAPREAGYSPAELFHKEQVRGLLPREVIGQRPKKLNMEDDEKARDKVQETFTAQRQTRSASKPTLQPAMRKERPQPRSCTGRSASRRQCTSMSAMRTRYGDNPVDIQLIITSRHESLAYDASARRGKHSSLFQATKGNDRSQSIPGC